jgi:Fe-S cluster assembly ATP-binding protein
LELRNITLSITEGETRKDILKGINLTLKEGQMYAITGPNGGGKTSIAKIIMGIYKPSSGQVLFDGEDISHLGVTERARLGIAYAFQQPPRFKGLKVADMLHIANADLGQMQMRALLRDLGMCPEDYMDRDVGPGLSGGEIKRIEVAQVLARESARMAVFDEPEAGVDLWTIQKLISTIIRNFKGNREKTVAVITHNQQFLPVCDEIVVVAEGRVEAVGRPDQIWPLIKDDIMCRVSDQCGGGHIELG